MDMKSISQKLQDDIRAIMEAGLHPNQQKIDVHEPEKDKITADDFKKLRAMKKTKDGKIHNCATHVEHAVLGKGTTVSEQHAEPDENGNIAWYTVDFETGTHRIATKELTITMSEAHMHESEQVDEEEKKKVVSPFDYKNYTSQIPKKPGEMTGHDSKKISTGTVYTKKPVKENTDIVEARKLEGTYSHSNGNQSKVYKLSGEHDEGDPYHVKLFKGGKHYEPADYFTNDKEDAHATAKSMVKEERTDEAMSHQAKTTMKHIPNPSPALKKAAKDIKPGIAGYRDRIAMLKAGGVKEEVESINELSTDTLKSYEKKATMDYAVKRMAGDDVEKRRAGVKAARARLANEDVEALDELSKTTLGSYAKKATTDAVIKRKIAGDFENMSDRSRKPGMKQAADVNAQKYKEQSWKRRHGVDKAIDRLTKEEAEQKDYTFAEYLDAARAQYVDEDAVLVANEAFKNKDITLFTDQSQSPEA